MDRQKNTLLKSIKSILFFLFITISLIGCGSISDGEYAASVTLTGGSGKASIDSPCKVTVKNGKATADITWSSSNYDYMMVDGVRYDPVNEDGNSEFIIPIKLEKKMKIQADTVAMSTPHLIDYELFFSIKDAKSGDKAGNPEEFGEESGDANDEGADSADIANKALVNKAPDIEGLEYLSTDQNAYADCYAIHRYNDGYAVLSVYDGRNYLIVPEGKDIPKGVKTSGKKAGKGEGAFTVIQKPLDKIYLAASSAMCQFDSIGAIGKIALSGIERDNWYIESAKKSMDAGTLGYGGKYSAPDYEKIVSGDIQLAIESTMILHTPKVMEKLEKLGVPVLIDRSSYESEPLGRCEWIKVYGLLTDKENEAKKAFEEQVSLGKAAEGGEKTGKKVVFFSINSKHLVHTRRDDDYFAKMVEKAGGDYIAPGSSDAKGNSSYISVSVEAFYDYAKDADILIYNSTIEDSPESLDALKSEEAILADFKAVKDGNVWYTDKSLYQFTDRTGMIISDLSGIFTGNLEDTEFFHKLQ